MKLILRRNSAAVALAKWLYHRAKDGGRWFDPRQRRKLAEEEAARTRVESLLANIARHDPQPSSGRILIDASYDNPNYWFRLGLLRAAIGTGGGHEVGMTGRYNISRCRETLRRLGVEQADSMIQPAAPFRDHARKLLAPVHSADDLLSLKLPYGLPAEILYDTIQHRQRSAKVDISDAALIDDVAECLAAIHAAERLLMAPTSMVLLSHIYGMPYSAVGWLAAQRGIPTFVLGVSYGSMRLTRIDNTDGIIRVINRPRPQDLEGIRPCVAEQLRSAADRYLAERFAGRTTDIAVAICIREATCIDGSGRDREDARVGRGTAYYRCLRVTLVRYAAQPGHEKLP